MHFKDVKLLTFRSLRWKKKYLIDKHETVCLQLIYTYSDTNKTERIFDVKQTPQEGETYTIHVDRTYM